VQAYKRKSLIRKHMTLSLNIPILTQLRLNLTASPGAISHSKSRLPKASMVTFVNIHERLLQAFRGDHAAKPQLSSEEREVPLCIENTCSSRPNCESPLTILTRLLTLTCLLILGFTQGVEAQSLYVSNFATGKIGVYNASSGAAFNASLVSGLISPAGIVVSGSNMYVANMYVGTIGVYNITSGAVVNASLVSGLNDPAGIAVSGSNIYVTNYRNGTIGAYTTSGGVVNPSLVSGLTLPFGIVLSGSNIYVADSYTGRIGVYNTTSGAVVNASLVSGLDTPTGIAISGSNIYVVNNGSGTIGVYNASSGAVVNANLVSGLNSPAGIAVSGSNIYVSGKLNGIIGVYNAVSGAVVNANLVSGLSYPYFLVVVDATDNTNGGESGSGGTATPFNIVAGTSVGLSGLGVTANPVLAGGTLVLNKGDSSGLSFAITSTGGTIQQPTSGSATLSGVFSGAGGLTFIGTGSTTMSGANTYSGGTTVSGGTLVVAGPSPTGTGDVFVASAGTLMGTGTIAGNGLVSGVLKPGNSPGYLSFTQNLTLNAGSTYQQDIAGTTQASSATPVGASGYYSFITVGSQLTINSGATLTPRLSNLFTSNESGYGNAIYVPALGDRFRMVTAAGGISGRFNTLTQPAELASGSQFIAFYNVNGSNSLDLAVTPISYSTTLSSSTTNAKEVANVLDQIIGVNKTGNATAAQDSLLYFVAGQTLASLPGFAQALSGEVHAASAATLPQAMQRVQQAVLARLGDFSVASNQINPALNNALLTGGISATNPSGLPTANMSTNPAVNPNTGNVTSAAVKDGRAWGEIAYQRAERASNSAGNGFNSNLYQIVTGVDAYSNAELGLKLGGGISLSNTTVSATGGNSTIQQGSLFVYGKMPVLQDYVLDGMASVGLSSTNLSRNDPTGYTGGFSSKAVMGNDALVSVGLSRAFEYNDVRVTPYARLTYQYVGQNSYDEDSGAAALNIARFSGSAVRGVIGVAAGSLNKDPLKDDYTYRANLSVGADTSGLLNPTLNTNLGGYSSSVTTATAGSAFVQVGLYGTVKVSNNAYAYAGVSGEARTGQTLYGGSVGLRMAF
jgi:autotransporter-associated beta strand protein